MNNESSDLQVLLALRQQPGAAPLKNEKAGLFCCSQISPLLKNPIKRQKKVTFPFSAMTHGERPLSGQRWGPLMRPVRGFRPQRKGVYWLTEPALRLLHSVNHLQTLFFVALFSSGHQWSPISRALCVEPVPSFNFITAGLTARQQGGQTASFDPAWSPSSGATFSAAIYPQLPPPFAFLSFFFSVVILSLSLPFSASLPVVPTNAAQQHW